MFSRRDARVPLSNGDIERQVALSYSELKRARAVGGDNDLREIWFEDQMNAGLDVLLARGYGQDVS